MNNYPSGACLKVYCYRMRVYVCACASLSRPCAGVWLSQPWRGFANFGVHFIL